MAVLVLLVCAYALATSVCTAASVAPGETCLPPQLLNHSKATPEQPPATIFSWNANFSLSPAGGQHEIHWIHRSAPLNKTHISLTSQLHNTSLTVTLSVTLSISSLSSSDAGYYIVSVSDICGKGLSNFSLTVGSSCPNLPSPTGSTHSVLVVPEKPEGGLNLVANFTGNPNPYISYIVWTRDGEYLNCDEMCTTDQTSPGHGSCLISAILSIFQASVAYSGKYTVGPIGNDSEVSFDLRVLPRLMLVGSPVGRISANKSMKHVDLVYRMANYTEGYMVLAFLLNDTELVNPTKGSGYNLSVSPNPLCPENVTVTLRVPLEKPGKYKMCFGFSAAVSQRPCKKTACNCSPPTTVAVGPHWGASIPVTEIVIPAVIGGLLLFMGVACAIVAWSKLGRKRRRKRHRGGDDGENKPLLIPTGTSDESSDEEETDGVKPTLQSVLAQCSEAELTQREFVEIANCVRGSRKVIIAIGNRLIEAQQMTEHVERHSDSHSLCIHILRAWYADIMMPESDMARNRLVTAVYHSLPVLAVAIARCDYNINS